MRKISSIIILIFISSLILSANVMEDEILRLINLERTKVALPPFMLSPRLQAMALYHSDNMAKKGFFSNIDLEGLDAIGRQKKLYPEMIGSITENLYKLDVMSITDKMTAATIVKNWMASPDNKRNILNPDFNYTGIGAVKKGVGVYVTETFGNIIAETVTIPKKAKYESDVTVRYRILNNAPIADFSALVKMPDKSSKVKGEDGKLYEGAAIYKAKNDGNNIISVTFPAVYGKGDYTISLSYKGEHYPNTVNIITVE